jgi:hypothetical protein
LIAGRTDFPNRFCGALKFPEWENSIPAMDSQKSPAQSEPELSRN